jgi:CheY-like chemotaxis protein
MDSIKAFLIVSAHSLKLCIGTTPDLQQIRMVCRYVFLNEGARKVGKTIMVVDDEQVFHDLYAEMLEDTDYRLIHVYDGDEALLKLEEDKPDLFILDMLMDMMTGDTFFLYLKGMPECTEIPIIVISAMPKRSYKSLVDVDQTLTFLDKSVTKGKLIQEIKAKIG